MADIPELVKEVIDNWANIVGFFADSRAALSTTSFVSDSLESELSSDHAMCGHLKMLSIVVSECMFVYLFLNYLINKTSVVELSSNNCNGSGVLFSHVMYFMEFVT